MWGRRSVVGQLRFDEVAVLGVVTAGTVASIRAGVGALAVLFAVIGALAVGRAMATRRRRAIGVRADLAGWLDQVAATTGEPVEQVLDRSVSAYRSSLSAPASSRRAPRDG
jgi:hypothetical protein